MFSSANYQATQCDKWNSDQSYFKFSKLSYKFQDKQHSDWIFKWRSNKFSQNHANRLSKIISRCFQVRDIRGKNKSSKKYNTVHPSFNLVFSSIQRATYMCWKGSLRILHIGVHKVYHETNSLLPIIKLKVHDKEKRNRVKLIISYKSVMDSNELLFDFTGPKIRHSWFYQDKLCLCT